MLSNTTIWVQHGDVPLGENSHVQVTLEVKSHAVWPGNPPVLPGRVDHHVTEQLPFPFCLSFNDLVAVDVSGKGLGAAMAMTNLQAALRTIMTFCSELGEAAEHVNRHLCQNLRDDMFVTLFLGTFEPLENKLSYVNAGHVQPMVMLPGQEARPLVGEVNIPLGIFDQPIKVVIETLPPGSRLVVVTDGITEAPSPDGSRFEVEGLAKTITESGASSARQLVSAITKKVTDYRQTMAQQDDITIFVLINSRTDTNS